MVNKKVTLELVGLDGNAFSLMGAFKCQAHREKWTPAEIKEVLDEAMSGEYSHLVATLDSYCQPEFDEDEDIDLEDASDRYGD